MPIWLGWTLAGSVTAWALGRADDAAEEGAQLAKWVAVLVALLIVWQAMKGRRS